MSKSQQLLQEWAYTGAQMKAVCLYMLFGYKYLCLCSINFVVFFILFVIIWMESI